MSQVINAPAHQNNGGAHENRVTHYANEPADKTSGANTSMPAHAFEGRVTQEQGSH